MLSDAELDALENPPAPKRSSGGSRRKGSKREPVVTQAPVAEEEEEVPEAPRNHAPKYSRTKGPRRASSQEAEE